MLDQPLNQRLREIREARELPGEESVPESQPEPRQRAPLGQLLIEKGAITEDVLDNALERQQGGDSRPLGQILIAMGAITPHNLARTLTEQHGFDFSGSLRARLGGGTGPAADGSTDERPGASPNEPIELEAAERYRLVETDAGRTLHTAATFLDAADAAFELIDEQDPEGLEIIRDRAGERESVWSYRRETAGFPPDHPSRS